MLYQNPLAFLPVLSPWLLLLTAVLLSIGFHTLFSRRSRDRFERRHAIGTDGEYEYRSGEEIDDNNPYIKTSFSETY